jgi:hypothetical protein
VLRGEEERKRRIWKIRREEGRLIGTSRREERKGEVISNKEKQVSRRI